jgi:hypothetical protein
MLENILQRNREYSSTAAYYSQVMPIALMSMLSTGRIRPLWENLKIL